MRFAPTFAALALLATPALAQGLDSKHSPYPASAYSGWVGNAPVLYQNAAGPARAAAYRYSGPHAGGPANALPRF